MLLSLQGIPVTCTKTGVKYLQRRAQDFDIGNGDVFITGNCVIQCPVLQAYSLKQTATVQFCLVTRVLQPFLKPLIIAGDVVKWNRPLFN